MSDIKNITPQGPSGYPLIGNLLNLASSQRLVWLQSLTDKYGDVSKFKILKREFYLVNHPDLVRELLVQKIDNYTKRTVAFSIVKKVLGESTFTATGDVWKRKRKLVQPSFHKKRISNLGEIMTDAIEDMLNDWELICDKNETVEMTDAMMRLTLTVVVKALFSTALSKEEVQTVADVFTPLLDETNFRASFPIRMFHKLRAKKDAAYEKNIADLDEIIFRIIRERRTSSKPHNDLLQMLMEAQDEETGELLSNEELRDEVMTVFIAGHETTANAMSWLWAILSQQPDIRKKVEQEVAEVLGDRKPTAADFPNLSYSLKVFKETLRLYPPVPILPRRVEADDVLGGYEIKGGGEVFFSAYLLHRRPDFWENPETFDPNRFERETERKQHPFAYLPFGGGPRICLGNSFAMMEAVFIVAMTTQRFRLNLVSDKPIEPLISLTTRPKGGVEVSLERR
ncbi:MAG: cytochrome P450 [Granulosicoccus sp.]|jgi:cytochrome P450